MTPRAAKMETAAAREGRIERGVLIGKALSHRIRIEILICLGEGGRPTSPPEMTEAGVAPQASNQHLNYHVAELRKAGCLRDVGQRQRRGAAEHFYVLRSLGREIAELVTALDR